MKIKSTTRYHFIPTRLVKTQKPRPPPNVVKKEELIETLQSSGWKCKCYNHFGNSLVSSYILTVYLPYDWVIPFTQETGKHAHQKTNTKMFLTASFLIVNMCKQPKCSTAGKWINKLGYMYTVEYHPAHKNE